MQATANRRTAVRKLTEAKAKVARWRAGCRGPGRIPNRLWMLAGEAAAEVGVEHAAMQLDVSAARLREWVKKLDQRVAPTETTPPDFIELTPMPLPMAGECVVEIAEPSGRSGVSRAGMSEIETLTLLAAPKPAASSRLLHAQFRALASSASG